MQSTPAPVGKGGRKAERSDPLSLQRGVWHLLLYSQEICSEFDPELPKVTNTKTFAPALPLRRNTAIYARNALRLRTNTNARRQACIVLSFKFSHPVAAKCLVLFPKADSIRLFRFVHVAYVKLGARFRLAPRLHVAATVMPRIGPAKVSKDLSLALGCETPRNASGPSAYCDGLRTPVTLLGFVLSSGPVPSWRLCCR